MRFWKSIIAVIAALALNLGIAGTSLAVEPEQIVQRLYDQRPHTDLPPGGPEIWMEHLQELWAREKAREVKALDIDFMTADKTGAYSDLKVEVTISSDAERRVGATLKNGSGDTVTIDYGFVQGDGGTWQIAEVLREDQGWYLSEALGKGE